MRVSGDAFSKAVNFTKPRQHPAQGSGKVGTEMSSLPGPHRNRVSLAKPLIVAVLPTAMFVIMGLAYLRHEAKIAEQQLRMDAERFTHLAAERLGKAYQSFLASEEILLRSVDSSSVRGSGLPSPRVGPEDSAAFARYVAVQGDREKLGELIPELEPFHTPAGLPLQSVAWLQLAKLFQAEGDKVGTSGSLQALLPIVVETKPSLVSGRFLEVAETLATSEGIAESLDFGKWKSAFLAKEETRNRLRRGDPWHPSQLNVSRWFEDEGEEFYWTTIPNKEVIVFSKAELQALAGDALEELWPMAKNGPRSLAIGLSFETESIKPVPFDDVAIRKSRFEESGFAQISHLQGMKELDSSGTLSPFSVRVLAADWQAFQTSVRSRTLVMGAIFTAATCCLVFGFWTTWRTLVFQRNLNEQQSNLIACVSHELRSPVAGIRLLVERLSGEGRDLAEAGSRKYLRLVAKETDRLAGLIDRVLDTGQITEGRKRYDFEWIDLLALTRDSAEQFSVLAEEVNKTVIWRTEVEKLHFMADALALQQALGNLIDNALKFSDEGAEVTVSVHDSRDEFRVSVADRGWGIAAEEIPKIFDLFYRSGSELRRETTGTGLGLFLVKKIVEAHGGRVEVESRVGTGSEFSLVFPMAAREPDETTRHSD